MAVNRATTGLNFSGGIHTVSHVEHDDKLPELPKAKRIIYFNEDAAPSHLSKLFHCFNAKRLLEKVCRPTRHEYEVLQSTIVPRPAMESLQLLKALETPIDPELKEQAETILMKLAEIELKVQVQRNLLVKV